MKGLIQYALTISIILGTAFQSLAAPSPREQVEEAAIYLPVELDVDVTWINCTSWNGFYYPGQSRIELCRQNLAMGVGVARFIFLHELGHAYTFQNGLGYARWGGNYEAAADEWAAVMSITQGHPRDILEIANAYEAWGRLNPWHKGDPHPPMELRASNMRKLYYGWLYSWSVYGHDWREALAHWKKELLAHGLN